MIANQSIWGALSDLANNNVFPMVKLGAPISGDGNGVSGKGSFLIDATNGNIYINTGSLSSTVWTQIGGASGATLVNANLTGTTTIGAGATITSPAINSPVISTLGSNFSTATVSAGYSSDTYLAGSNINQPVGGFTAGMLYTCEFDMVKTAAGTAAFTITLRIGTAGTTADAAILTFAFAVGTAAADTGTFEVWAYFRTVGATTTAVMVGSAFCSHALAATGLITTGASGNGQVTVVSSGFDSTIAATKIGLSVNGGASFSGTNTLVKSELHGF